MPNEVIIRSHKRKTGEAEEVVDEEELKKIQDEEDALPPHADYYAFHDTLEREQDKKEQAAEQRAIGKQQDADRIEIDLTTCRDDAVVKKFGKKESSDTLKEGSFISCHILGRALSANNVPWVDTQMIIHPHLKPMPEAIASGNVHRVAVVAWHSDHFIAVIADKNAKMIHHYDSLSGYSTH